MPIANDIKMVKFTTESYKDLTVRGEQGPSTYSGNITPKVPNCQFYGHILQCRKIVPETSFRLLGLLYRRIDRVPVVTRREAWTVRHRCMMRLHQWIPHMHTQPIPDIVAPCLHPYICYWPVV